METKLTKVFLVILLFELYKLFFVFISYLNTHYYLYFQSYNNFFFTEIAVSLKHCSYCGNIFTPETCRVRIRPKLSLNRNLSKLLERHKENPEALSKYQKNLVQRYLRSKNVLVCMLSAIWIEKLLGYVCYVHCLWCNGYTCIYIYTYIH